MPPSCCLFHGKLKAFSQLLESWSEILQVHSFSNANPHSDAHGLLALANFHFSLVLLLLGSGLRDQ